MMPTRTPKPASPAQSSSPGGFGYFTGVAPISLDAARPAGEEPEIRSPGRSSGGTSGVSRRFLTL